MNGNPWTKREVATLTILWPKAPKEEVFRSLPMHTHLSVERKASELKLRRSAYRSKLDRNADPFFASLRRVRERQNLTRQDLAARLGYHHGMIGRWERGESLPNWFKIRAWMDALGVTIQVMRKKDVT